MDRIDNAKRLALGMLIGGLMFAIVQSKQTPTTIADALENASRACADANYSIQMIPDFLSGQKE